MNIIIEEIVVNPLIHIEETIEEITIEVSEMSTPGPHGEQGIAGKTAYQSALDGGFVGTELEFNQFLSEVDQKLNISDYNDRFKGVYLTLDALNLALPTANAGDSAQVNEVGATDVVNYSWDAEENIWVQSGASGSAATNTDALPEGTSNLYFTTARVLSTFINGVSFLIGTPIVSTDSILVALGKLQKQISDNLTAISLKANNNDVVHLSQTETIIGKKSFNPALVASANNEVLAGLDIAPTFDSAGFSNVTNVAVRQSGDSIPSISNSFNLGNLASPWASVFTRVIRDLSSISYRCDTQGWFNNSNTQVGKLFASTGNWIFQNGGVFTDLSSAKIQINSTTQGFLPPRMTNAQRLAIVSPATGLVVYCTDTTEGLYVNKSTGWTLLL